MKENVELALTIKAAIEEIPPSDTNLKGSYCKVHVCTQAENSNRDRASKLSKVVAVLKFQNNRRGGNSQQSNYFSSNRIVLELPVDYVECFRYISSGTNHRAIQLAPTLLQARVLE